MVDGSGSGEVDTPGGGVNEQNTLTEESVRAKLSWLPDVKPVFPKFAESEPPRVRLDAAVNAAEGALDRLKTGRSLHQAEVMIMAVSLLEAVKSLTVLWESGDPR